MNVMASFMGGEGRPCWHCVHYGGLTGEGTCAVCLKGPGLLVRSLPANGCAFWEREIGADDDVEDDGRDASQA